MSYTDEQIRLYCECTVGPDPTGPDEWEWCCLHGNYDVEWQVAYLSPTGRLMLVGPPHRTDLLDHSKEPHLVVLNEAESSLAGFGAQLEYFLVRRLLLPRKRPNGA